MMRVLHSPTNIGNQPWTLSRAERDIGLKSDVVVNYQTRFVFPADRVLGSLNGRSKMELLKRAWFGWTAPFRYDVFHFYFGRSLLFWDDIPNLNYWSFQDLKLARRLGKRIFMTLQGCDARIAYNSNQRNEFTPCAPGRCAAYDTCLSGLDDQRRHLINDILPLCDKTFYLNPELGHELANATFLPYANVDIRDISFAPKNYSPIPRIVHAPSDPLVKGTEQILAALDMLSHKHKFELILVEGKTHSQAMEIYKNADLAIDQILYGWYGGFSVELMAMGTPVACYIRDEDLKYIPDSMREELPIMKIHPENLVNDLDKWLSKRSEWDAIGKRSRSFVEKWHDPKIIANNMHDEYLGKEKNCE